MFAGVRMPNEWKKRSTERVGKLLGVLADKRSLLILMQDNPDPDSLAAAAALRRIVNAKTEAQCSLAYGGVIGRGENRALADYLGLNFRRVGELDFAGFDSIALVDTQPGTGNNSLPAGRLPDIVLDHHPLRPDSRKASFTDIRSKYGALSTVLFEYLKALRIAPEPPLATALLYAIRTDTQDLGKAAVRADLAAAEELFGLANPRMLSSIQRGSVSREYFETMARALAGARLFDTCLVSDLGRIGKPDYTGEFADLFLRYEQADWVLCYGVFEGKIWASLRSAAEKEHAGRMLKDAVRGLGTGGGHDWSAGAQIPVEERSGGARKLAKTLRERLLKSLKIETRSGRRLVS